MNRDCEAIYLLAFDHRGSFQKKLLGIAGDPTPDEVARIFVPEFIRIRWKEISGELQATEPDLARAAARAVARSERLDAVWHVLSRLGLTRERAKALDRAVFRGAALTVWRRLTRAR